MKERDDTALKAALAAPVTLDPSSLPCLWPQVVPCKNLGLLRLPDGTSVCEIHYDRFFGQAA